MITLLLLAALSSPTKPVEASWAGQCYDGDTCTFELALGFGVRKTEDVRLCNIDTPEVRGTSRPQGLVARHQTMALLGGAKRVVIHVPMIGRCSKPNRCERRSFQRLLGWVIVDGVNLSEALVQSGHATRYTKQTCGDAP